MSITDSLIASIMIGTIIGTRMLERTRSALARISWFGSYQYTMVKCHTMEKDTSDVYFKDTQVRLNRAESGHESPTTILCIATYKPRCLGFSRHTPESLKWGSSVMGVICFWMQPNWWNNWSVLRKTRFIYNIMSQNYDYYIQYPYAANRHVI